jgi:hypothetical protein
LPDPGSPAYLGEANREETMADQENPEHERAAWTVKSMPVEARKLALACAQRQDETLAVWLERAVRNQASLEAGQQVLPPEPRHASPSRTTLSIPPRVVVPDTSGLADLLRATVETARAADVPVPKAVARHAAALATAQLRAARGLPPLAPRQTKSKNGQTLEHSAESEPVEQPVEPEPMPAA